MLNLQDKIPTRVHRLTIRKMKNFLYSCFLFFCCVSQAFAESVSTPRQNSVSVAAYPLAMVYQDELILPIETTLTHRSGHGIRAFYSFAGENATAPQHWFGLGYRFTFPKYLDTAWFHGLNIHSFRQLIDDQETRGYALTYELGRERSVKHFYSSFSFELGASYLEGKTYLMMYTFFGGLGFQL